MRSFRLLALVVCIPMLVLTSFAQQPSPTQSSAPPQQPATTAAAPTVPASEQIRKTVGFLTVEYGNSLADLKGGVIGTCFFVAVPDQRLGANQGFIYLVTNRHVAQPGIDLGTPYQVQAVMLRLNRVGPGGGLQSVSGQILLGGQVRWFFPSDEAVDLAILPVAPDQKSFDYLAIPSTMIVTAEQLKTGEIGVNDPVSFAGYFASFPGSIRMEPIVREGVIAMLPEEKLDTTLHKQGRLFLADIHAFHGNSGSPVFVNLGGMHHGVLTLGERYFLLGIISGYYPESAGFSVPAATVLTGEVHDNSGIATVVPGEELTNLLNSHEVQSDRDRQVKVLNRSGVSQK